MGGFRLHLPPSWRPAPHDALYLHLAVQADPEEARPAPALNVHSLRHTNASLLIAGGADVATVAGLLGHSQPSTTLDIYTHAFDKNKKAASQVLQEGLEI
ncbi:tyrosine-type recombinase/integrase [Dysosmobacter welbionis]